MTRMLRPLAVVLCSGIMAACSAATVGLSASPGETPGFNANPFNPGGPPTLIPVTLVSTITVSSVGGYSGVVTLSTECCHEVIRDRWMSLDPAIHFSSSFWPSSLNIPANGSATSALSIFVQPGSFPMVTSAGTLSAGIPYSKYLLKVVAKDQAGSTLATTNVGVRVLPRLEPHTGCRPLSVPSLVFQPLVAGLINWGEANPRKTPVVLALYLPGASGLGDVTAWRMEVFDLPVRPAHTAVVKLVNNTSSNQQKEISSVGCPGTGEFARAQKGLTSVNIILDQAQDNTLFFSQEECFITCGWKPIAVFAEPAFWSVFGGKTVTFTWMGP